MAARWIELATGSLEQKKQYKQYRARIEALPEPYRIVERFWQLRCTRSPDNVKAVRDAALHFAVRASEQSVPARGQLRLAGTIRVRANAG
jgi:hypothetical protein